MSTHEDADPTAMTLATDFTIVITPAVMRAATDGDGAGEGDARLRFVADCISDHRLGDWRYTSDALQAANRTAMDAGVGPIRSVWPLSSDAGWPAREIRLCVVTDGIDPEENDRPVVTAMFSSEAG